MRVAAMKPWIFARHAVVAGIAAVLVSWLAISGHAQPSPPMPRGPQFGDVIPGFLRDQLELSPDQARQLKALEAEVRERLAKS